MKYLEDNFRVIDTKVTERPKYGICADGYTMKSGAPTRYMIKLENEKIWRRVMCWQFSNVGTCFVRIKKENFVLKYEHLHWAE